ncbi:MAG: tetratricopeptide repeat protein [Cyanobacteria bacterium P01_D01_bin.71]
MSKRVCRQDSLSSDDAITAGLEMVALSVITPQPSGQCLPASAKTIRKRVQLAVKRGDLQKAIALLNRLMSRHAAKAEDFNNRGLLHLWNGNPYRAIQDFNQAIALNPELAAAYNNRANYYAEIGDEANALADYEHTIDLNPYHVRARINRSIALSKLGRFDEALEGFDAALLFRQFAGEVYAERGRTYHLRGDWNCAIADYRRALDLLALSNHESSRKICSYHYRVTAWLSQLDAAA